MYTTVKKSLLRGFAFTALASLMTILNAGSSQAQWATSGSNISNTNTGNVGVGTTTPDKLFTVQGQMASPGGTLSVIRTSGSYNGYGLTMDAAGTGNNNVGFTVNGAPKASLTFDVSRNFLGFINTAYSNMDFALRLNSDGSLTYHDSVNGAEKFRITNTGNVGIGTTSPGRPLVVTADASGIPLRIYRNANNVGWGTGIEWAFNNSAGSVTNYAYVNSSIISNTAGAENGTLGFFTVKSGTITQGAILDQNGNFGIGITNPSTKLHVVGDATVAGNINVTGNINAKYQDVAEWVPTTQKLSPGTVVVLDTQHANHVNASTISYDTRVAGVVSAQPGISLGEAGEGKALVATTGRVKVKVDATHAPIQIGDLIVTSDVEGVAMKSEPINVGGRQFHAPGTIIGKALESLAGGTGEILVLLSLQ